MRVQLIHPVPESDRVAIRVGLALVLAAACLPGRALGKEKEPGDPPRLRQVLKGVLYRSGSPSEDALQRMCREGWKRVYSLYGARTTAHGPPNHAMAQEGQDERRCTLPKGQARVLEWVGARSLPRIFRDVVDTVHDPGQGPVLVHCWNGLHYAGMISAMALRQFCGADADTAEAYWRANANPGARYPRIIEHIRAFRPLPGFALTPAERERLCPDLSAYKKEAGKTRQARQPGEGPGRG